MSISSWLIVHRPGFEFFLLPMLVLAAVLVWLERGNRKAAIPWVLVAIWIGLWAASLAMFGIMRYRSNLPALLMWSLLPGVGTLVPLVLAQIGNMAARRARSQVVHGAGIFAGGWLLGVPLMLIVMDFLTSTIGPIAGIR